MDSQVVIINYSMMNNTHGYCFTCNCRFALIYGNHGLLNYIKQNSFHDIWSNNVHH